MFSPDQLAIFLTEYSSYVPFISFGLLMLAGINIPISEDLVFIISASIAATVAPALTVPIFIGCFLGAFLSDICAYNIGRHGLARLVRIPFLGRFVPLHKIKKLEHYFERFGSKTLFFGRFIPFGVRNALFMTCGLAGMSPARFALVDLMAVSITSVLLFTLGYIFGQNYAQLIDFVETYNIYIGLGIIGFFVARILVKKFLRRKAQNG